MQLNSYVCPCILGINTVYTKKYIDNSAQICFFNSKVMQQISSESNNLCSCYYETYIHTPGTFSIPYRKAYLMFQQLFSYHIAAMLF